MLFSTLLLDKIIPDSITELLFVIKDITMLGKKREGLSCPPV